MNLLSPVFARIVKVDEATRTVVGRATQEMIDRDGEVFDYATSKPEFQRWSADVFQDSGGKSLGNVRSMHGTTAAGVLKDIQFDDHEKAIDVAAKIVDDNEWKKVQEGVYTGFSIGGRYARKWADIIQGKMVQRYTAVPSEISIVDRPCVPAAKFFTVHKVDGSTVEVAFKSFAPPANATTGLQGYDQEGAKKPARKDDRGAETAPTREDRIKDPNADDAIATNPNGGFGGKAASKARKVKDGDKWKVVGADGTTSTHASEEDANRKLATLYATKAEAMYAITQLDSAALTKFLASNQDAINKALNSTPDIEFTKGVYDVSQLASIIAQLKCMADGQAYERKVEGDASTVPEKIRESAATLLGLLSEMAREEGAELSSGTTMEDVLADTQPTMVPGLYRTDIGELAKSLREAFGIKEVGDELVKRGARNSAKDLMLIQKVHDAVCELGADCQTPSPHARNGGAAALPPTQKTSQDTLGKEETTMELKKDDVASEGNKRGAAVSSPSLPPNSANAHDAENTGDAGQEAGKRKGRAAAAQDGDDTMKSKPRVSKDDDDDDDDARKGKSRKVTKDDDDDDDDARKSKSKKVAKDDDDDDDARKFVMTDRSLADVIAKAVSAGVAAAMGNAAANQSNGAQAVTIPRVAPNLMSVGKDGGVAKVASAEELKKTVSPHPQDEREAFKAAGDNRTTSLIKAIHANRVTLDAVDLRAIGVPS